MHIREPTADDAPVLGRLHVRAWQEGYKDGLMPSEFLDGLSVAERVEMWEGILSREPRPRSGRIVSVHHDGTVTGFITVGPAEADPIATIGEVFSLNVDPDFWGQGHGGALLTAGVETLQREGFEEAVLWVHTDSRRSRRFYELHGWHPDGVQRTVEVLGVEVPESRYRLASNHFGA